MGLALRVDAAALAGEVEGHCGWLHPGLCSERNCSPHSLRFLVNSSLLVTIFKNSIFFLQAPPCLAPCAIITRTLVTGTSHPYSNRSLLPPRGPARCAGGAPGQEAGTPLLLPYDDSLALGGPGSRGGPHLGLTSPIPFFSGYRQNEGLFAEAGRGAGGQPQERGLTER